MRVRSIKARQTVMAYAFVSPALLVIAALIIFPLACLGVYSIWSLDSNGEIVPKFTLVTWQSFFADDFFSSILLKTLWLSFGATLVAAILAYGPAYFLTLVGKKWRGPLVALLFLPSWISYVVRTMSWLPVLGKTGLINSALLSMGVINAPLPLLYNQFSVYLGLVHFVLPLMILNIFIGLQTVDPNVIAAARTLGARAFFTFVTTIFPLALPGLAAGCLLSFILCLGAFITPMILGGPGSTYFSNLLYETIISQLDWPTGAMLSLIIVALLIVLVSIYGRMVGLATVMRSVKS